MVTLKSQVNAYRAEAEKQHLAAEGTLDSLQAVADERDVLNASLQAISCERDALKDQLGSLQQKIDHIVTTQLAEALKQISTMQNDHEEEVRTLRAEIEQTNAQSLKDLASAKEEGSRLLNDALSQLEISQNCVSQKQRELEDSVQTLIRLENEVKQMENERSEIELASHNSIRLLENDHSEAVQRALQSHDKQIQELQCKMESAQRNFDDLIQTKDRELHEAEKLLADSKAALIVLEQNYSRLQLESEQSKQLIVNESEQRQTDLALEIAKLQATVEENREHFLAMQQELGSKIGMVQVLEQALSSLSSKLEEVNLDSKKKTDEIVILQDTVHRKEQDIDLLEISKEQLKEQIERQSNKNDALQQQLALEESANAAKSQKLQVFSTMLFSFLECI